MKKTDPKTIKFEIYHLDENPCRKYLTDWGNPIAIKDGIIAEDTLKIWASETIKEKYLEPVWDWRYSEYNEDITYLTLYKRSPDKTPAEYYTIIKAGFLQQALDFMSKANTKPCYPYSMNGTYTEKVLIQKIIDNINNVIEKETQLEDLISNLTNTLEERGCEFYHDSGLLWMNP